MGKMYDVAIVGGGIAGCTAATLFGRAGLSVSLIEKHPQIDSYKKVCGHYIQPSALPTIQRLGIEKQIEEEGGVKGRMDIRTPWGWIYHTLGQNTSYPQYGYNLRRQKLDPLLRTLAQKTPTVDYMPGCTAQKICLDSTGKISGVFIKNQNKNISLIRARLLVAADGRHSPLAKLANISPLLSPNQRFAYFAYYKNISLSSGKSAQLWLLGKNIAYAFPTDDNLTLLACFLPKTTLQKFKQEKEKSFYTFMESLPDGPNLTQAKRVSPFLGMLNIPSIYRKNRRKNFALLGDAALSADPLWGVGCGWAFQSAEWLVDTSTKALLAKKPLESTLKNYRKKHYASLGNHYAYMNNFSSARELNFLEKLMISGAARDPILAQHMTAFGSRLISTQKFLAPSAILRASWIRLKHIYYERKNSGLPLEK